MTQIWLNLSTEMFPPSDLLAQGVEAERAGFDAVGSSDHFQPWWPDGESGQAWVLLGALAQATERVPVGTGVTPPLYRYHPVLVAQAFMTLEEMFPGRAFLGAGSGEALNEVPFGVDWPSLAEQQERFDEALEIIARLWAGETVTYEGKLFQTREARLWTRAEGRPRLYVSAFGPKAAQIAAKWGDGIWTLGDPDNAPAVLDAYGAACHEAGREPGEIILQSGVAWAADDQAAVEGARVWKATMPPEFYTEDWHDPAQMQEHAADVDDDAFRAANAIGSDPQVHVDRIRELEGLGATIVCLQNFSGADPHGTIDFYGREVLPQL
ncbi:MAG TPA: TIGR03557 family F420-dependent LLM class oxidoreductase [Solirubrobacteraceae bacterium]